MPGIKFIHCADIHLDMPFKEHGSGTYARTRRQDIRKSFLNIIRKAHEEQVDFILIAGDMYEHETVLRETMDWLSLVLSEARIPVIIIPGNHDPYLINSFYRNWEWPSNVSVLSPESPQLILEEHKVNIYGMGFTSFREGKPDLSAVPPPLTGYFNIFMLHGTLDMDFAAHSYKPVASGELEPLGYDYYALGHFHNIRDDYLLKTAFNPGSPEPLGFDETGMHGAFIVNVEKEEGKYRIEASHFSSAIRVYHEKHLDISGCKTLEEVKIRILGVLEGLDPEQDIVRVTLKGRTDLSLDMDTLSSLFSGHWFYLKFQNDTMKAFDLDALIKDTTLKGAFAREMKSRLDTISDALKNDPHNRELLLEEERLRLALQFGLEAVQNGRIECWNELEETMI